MALATLISGPFRLSLAENTKGASDTGAKFTTILLVDVTTSEVVSKEADVTSNPVEEGQDINDNMRLKPITIQVDGFISEAPLNLQASIQGLAAAAGGAIGNLAGGFGASVGQIGAGFGAKLMLGAQDPASQARQALERIMDEKKLVRVVTKRKDYTDMVLVSLTFPRDQSAGQGLRFQARFQQINIVSAQVVQISKLAKSASHSAAPKSKLGNQTTTTPNAQVQSKGSVLYKAVYGGLF